MGARARRWFLVWGILFAVFVVRGLLPWLIVWMALPGAGTHRGVHRRLLQRPRACTRRWSPPPRSCSWAAASSWCCSSSTGSSWSRKQFGLAGEKFFASQGVWFFAVAAVFLALTVWFSLRIGSMVAFSAVIGSTRVLHHPRLQGERGSAGEAAADRRALGHEQDPVPGDHRHDLLHRRRAGCLRLHPVGARSSSSATAWARSSCARSPWATSSASSGCASSRTGRCTPSSSSGPS